MVPSSSTTFRLSRTSQHKSRYKVTHIASPALYQLCVRRFVDLTTLLDVPVLALGDSARVNMRANQSIAAPHPTRWRSSTAFVAADAQLVKFAELIAYKPSNLPFNLNDVASVGHIMCSLKQKAQRYVVCVCVCD